MPARDVAFESKPNLIGSVVLGRYRVVRPLAQGGMGIVYLGRVEGAAGFAKPVVIKCILAAQDGGSESQQLFAREARIVSNLQHPGIVAVIDFGEVGSSQVMVLEYVHGYHLGQWSRFVRQVRGKLEVPLALHPMLSVLDALDFAHALARPDGMPLDIVHRDISPANVLIDFQGHVKLGDFGIARTADDEYKTQEGMFRGTLPFAAPEVLQGGSATAKVNQYACAVVLYQLLSGQNPFKGNDSAETLGRVLNHVPPPLSTLRDNVPPALDAALARALSKVPEARFASAGEFADALREARAWSERDEADGFARQIKADFAGNAMAEALGVEALSVRDASWREAQDDRTEPVTLSSSPPGISERAPAIAAKLPLERSDAPTRPHTPEAKSRSEPSSKIGLWLALGGLAVAALVVVVALASRPAPDAAPKVLVIEKQDAPQEVAAPPTPAPPPAEASAAAASADTPAPSKAPSVKRAPAAPAADRGALLAKAFQRQEGKIQSCFQQHGASLDGQPAISVRFQVDETGSVQRAQVSPSSVASTPLGPCLLAVARATQFGPQPEPTTFAIPISARVVRH